MPLIKPDLSEVNKPIEPGTYSGRIVSVEAKTSGAGNPMIVPKFEIEVNGKTKYRNSYLVIVGAAAFGFESLLRATGFVDAAISMKNGNPPEFDTDSLIDQECLLIIDSDTYNGEIVDRITGFLPK